MNNKHEDKTTLYFKQHLAVLGIAHIAVMCLTTVSLLPFYVWADLITVSGLLFLFAITGAMLRDVLE